MDAAEKETPGGSRGRFESAQVELFEQAQFSPEFPTSTSLAGRALQMLLTGAGLTHPDFQAATRSWRLASPIERLRKMGWPILSLNADGLPVTGRHVGIARYVMDARAIEAVGGAAHG